MSRLSVLISHLKDTNDADFLSCKYVSCVQCVHFNRRSEVSSLHYYLVFKYTRETRFLSLVTINCITTSSRYFVGDLFSIEVVNYFLRVYTLGVQMVFRLAHCLHIVFYNIFR
uniref:Uncharacterized protein n=1 Tax=Schistocephalus solidus TaxID=70667 RepID=A0A0V0J6E5_SCHSO